MHEGGLRRIDSRHLLTTESDTPSVTLVCNPADDDSFVALAEAALRRAPGGPDAFERLLRMRFPRTVVRRRDLSSEPHEVWYVYRDGHWTPRGQREDEGAA